MGGAVVAHGVCINESTTAKWSFPNAAQNVDGFFTPSDKRKPLSITGQGVMNWKGVLAPGGTDGVRRHINVSCHTHWKHV